MKTLSILTIALLCALSVNSLTASNNECKCCNEQCAEAKCCNGNSAQGTAGCCSDNCKNEKCVDCCKNGKCSFMSDKELQSQDSQNNIESNVTENNASCCTHNNASKYDCCK